MKDYANKVHGPTVQNLRPLAIPLSYWFRNQEVMFYDINIVYLYKPQLEE